MVNAEIRNWVFVKVETDQPGLCGWGEEAAAKHPYQREVIHSTTIRAGDGAILDW